MTKREEQDLVDATRRVVARWTDLSHDERIVRLKVAGILDDAGELSARYRPPSNAEKARVRSARG